jgi:hypothetical protein
MDVISYLLLHETLSNERAFELSHRIEPAEPLPRSTSRPEKSRGEERTESSPSGDRQLSLSESECNGAQTDLFTHSAGKAYPQEVKLPQAARKDGMLPSPTHPSSFVGKDLPVLCTPTTQEPRPASASLSFKASSEHLNRVMEEVRHEVRHSFLDPLPQ